MSTTKELFDIAKFIKELMDASKRVCLTSCEGLDATTPLARSIFGLATLLVEYGFIKKEDVDKGHKINTRELVAIIEDHCREICDACDQDINHNTYGNHGGCNALLLRQCIDEYKRFWRTQDGFKSLRESPL